MHHYKKNGYTAFIFARGGSQSVKNKNIRKVSDKPLIAYSILTGLSSNYISKVVVSTDSHKISSVAKSYGAEVLVRPDELATSTSNEILSWRHAIETYFKDSTEHKLFISIPATSPLKTKLDIDNAISKFLENQYDLLLTITESQRSPYFNMVTINSKNHIELVSKNESYHRRQDTPKCYDITTTIYVSKFDYILNCKSLLEGNIGYSYIPTHRSLDVDTEYDLHIADLLLKNPYKLLEDNHE